MDGGRCAAREVYYICIVAARIYTTLFFLFHLESNSWNAAITEFYNVKGCSSSELYSMIQRAGFINGKNACAYHIAARDCSYFHFIPAAPKYIFTFYMKGTYSLFYCRVNRHPSQIENPYNPRFRYVRAFY